MGDDDKTLSKSPISIFSVLLSITLAAPVINFQISYISFALIYLGYGYLRFIENRELGMNRNSFLFVLYLLISLFTAVVHFGASTPDGDFFRTLELVWVFCLFLLVYESVGYLTSKSAIHLKHVAVGVVALAPLFLAIRVGYVFAAGEVVSWADLFRLRGHANKLIQNNPNHVDNITFVLAASLAWALVYFSLMNRKSVLIMVTAGAFLCLYTLLYLTTKTLGGFLGLAAGVSFAVLLFFLMRRSLKSAFLVIVPLVLIGTSLAFVLGEKLLVAPVVQAQNLMGEGAADRIRNEACLKRGINGRPEFSGDLALVPSVTYRAALALNSFEIWLQKPVFGHGFYDGDFFAKTVVGSIPCISEYFHHPHSLYSDVAIRGGLVLLAIYLVTFAAILLGAVRVYSQSRGIRVALLTPMIVYIIYLIVENLFELSFTSSDALIAGHLNMLALWAVTGFTKDYEAQ